MAKSNIPPMIHAPVHVSPHGFGRGSSPAAPPSGPGNLSKGPPHMAQGGTSSHGEAMQSKYCPGSGGGASSPDSNPHISKPYDSDGDDWL